MKALCFEENDRLDLTEYTQAALVTTCLAMEKVVEEMGLHPDVTAGLSLGEYCAIEAAGGMELKDAVTTVRKGILMEQAVPAGREAWQQLWEWRQRDRGSACRHCRCKHCKLQPVPARS